MDGNEYNGQAGQQSETPAENTNEPTVYGEGIAPADKERIDAEYADATAVSGTGAESTSTPQAEGKNEAGAPVPKGSVDDVTASDEDRLKAAYASFKVGMLQLSQHSAANIPGSLFYDAITHFKLAAVGFEAVLGDKKQE